MQRTALTRLLTELVGEDEAEQLVLERSDSEVRREIRRLGGWPVIEAYVDGGPLQVGLCRLGQLMEQGPHAGVFGPLDPQIDSSQLRPTSMAGLDQRHDPPAPAPAEIPTAAAGGRPSLLDPPESDGGAHDDRLMANPSDL